MEQRMSRVWARAAMVMVLGTVPFFAGCGDAPEEAGSSGTDQVAQPGKGRDEYLPFSIKFDLDGNPVIVDEKGNRVEAEQTKLPVEATSIAGVQSISVVTYTGSCKQVISIGGKLYTITLPDSYCKSL